MSPSGGWTATALALDLARLMLDPMAENGARPVSEGIPRVAVLITDGMANIYPITEAAPALQDSGVQVDNEYYMWQSRMKNGSTSLVRKLAHTKLAYMVTHLFLKIIMVATSSLKLARKSVSKRELALVQCLHISGLHHILNTVL